MKLFFNYFRRYFTQDFNLSRHLLLFVFIALCIWANYQFDIYANHFRVTNQSFIGVLKLWAMYLFAFLVSLLILGELSFKKKSNLKYIIYGALGLFLVSLDSSYYLLKYIRNINDEINISRFTYACLANVISLITIVIPIFTVYYFTKQFKPELYGLRMNGASLKPYFWLILLMAPVVYFSAYFDPNFLSYYPSYNSRAADVTGLSTSVTVLIYEFCYGFDFFSVELLFRGFMVVALSKFLGKKAILPMVACYAFLHFGKPMWETIGSVFGGLGLGILAYESKNIYGGLIVYLGVAWGMEFVAFILN